LGALQHARRQVQHASRGDQTLPGLDQIGAVDRVEGRAAIHVIAGSGEERDDLARHGGKDRDRHLLIEVDRAHGVALNGEDAFQGWLDLELLDLGRGEVDALGRQGIRGRPRRGPVRRSVVGGPGRERHRAFPRRSERHSDKIRPAREQESRAQGGDTLLVTPHTWCLLRAAISLPPHAAPRVHRGALRHVLLEELGPRFRVDAVAAPGNGVGKRLV